MACPPPLATAAPSAAVEAVPIGERPDRFGRFGRFGGKYVPETLMHALSELETAFETLSKDEEFQVCVKFLLGYLEILNNNAEGENLMSCCNCYF